MIRHLVLVSAALTLAACGAPTSPPTGLGATVADWHAHHGAGYRDVLADARGRVSGFTLATSPRSLAAMEALVLRDLPAGATASAAVPAEGVEGTKCQIVDYTAPSLRAILGSDRVMAVFSTAAAVTMDTTKIDHVVVVSAAEHYPRAC